MKEIDAAIEALEVGWSPHYTGKDARALAEAALDGLRSLKEQEPVAWVDTDKGVIVGTPRFFSDGSHGEVALYTHPAPEAKQERIAELEAELQEQARVNGMGGEREAALLAKNVQLLEALKRIMSGVSNMERDEKYEQARAAIKAAEGEL